MASDVNPTCSFCGAKIVPQVPEYYMELECFRLMSTRLETVPRRGSREYHEVMQALAPEVHEAYFQNREMYDRGHLWCSVCGGRLPEL